MLVYVLNKDSKPLMPTNPVKARILLKEKKAKVVKRSPFTIQLLYGSSGYKQPIVLGVDSGYKHIGLCAIDNKKELFCADVELRSDIVKLNAERRAYRRTRRSRKTRYREARFLNRRKPEGWLAPSIQHKVDSHIKIIKKISEILSITNVNFEVASFDIQKIKNPDISGVEYQNGEQKDSYNTREYVLFRDNFTCQHCKGKSGDKILEVHHIVSRQIGGNRPDNLITLCKTCHNKVSKKELNLNIKPSKSFKAETFMSMVRWRIINRLKELGFNVKHTYGYLTKSKRIELGLDKSHMNDAFVIANGNNNIIRNNIQYFVKQVRKCNRKLFKGIRSHIRNTAGRFVNGFQRFDKVKYKGVECFIFGRRTSGYFDIRKLDGTVISSSVRSDKLKLIERSKTLLIENISVLHSPLKKGVSELKEVSWYG